VREVTIPATNDSSDNDKKKIHDMSRDSVEINSSVTLKFITPIRPILVSLHNPSHARF
jgi:hypothetical protein